MDRRKVDCSEIKVSPFTVLDKGWMLLAAGDFKSGGFNAMTIAWGALGTMWSKPLVMVVVRPTRYTYEFMESGDSFTVCAFPEQYREGLKYMGGHSGRDTDKAAGSGLTPSASETIAAPCFAEADLVLECRKIYYDDLDPSRFLAEYISPLYKNDYHRMYFGEVSAAFSGPRFL